MGRPVSLRLVVVIRTVIGDGECGMANVECDGVT